MIISPEHAAARSGPKSDLFFQPLLFFFLDCLTGVCKWNLPSRMKSIVFIFSATQSDCCKKQTADEMNETFQ
jgi:hypothetical protein